MTPARIVVAMAFCLFCLANCYLEKQGINEPLDALLKTRRAVVVQQHNDHPSHRNTPTDQPRPCHPRGQVNITGDRMELLEEKDPKTTAFRCKNCNKKLAHGIVYDITIRCPRCKQDTRFINSELNKSTG